MLAKSSKVSRGHTEKNKSRNTQENTHEAKQFQVMAMAIRALKNFWFVSCVLTQAPNPFCRTGLDVKVLKTISLQVLIFIAW